MGKQQDSHSDRILSMREALAQTVSSRDFSTAAMESLAEHLMNKEDKVSYDLVRNLLDTVEAENYGTETDFRLETGDVSLAESKYDNDVATKEDGVGRYKVLGHLGTGAAGQVFEVKDLNFDRSIAVKFLHPHAADRTDRMFDFINEAKLSAQLEHPNILPIHDVNISDSGMLYFSMQKASGKSLKDLLDDFELDGHLGKEIRDVNDRVSIMIKVCDAIAYAHSRGIVHQDIKPSNIMIGQFGEVVIVDWGTATYVSEVKSGRGDLVGTPIYMSPEQARREPPDYSSDIYCLGSTLFHILTLRFPTWSENIDEFWELKKKGVINPLSAKERKRVPGPLLSIALKAMHADAQQRYKSVQDMLNDLKAFQAGHKVSAHKDTIGDVWRRLYRHNKRAVWVACIGLVMAVFMGLVLYNELLKSQSRWNLYAEQRFEDSTRPLSEDWKLITFTKYSDKTLKELSFEDGSLFEVKDGSLCFTDPQLGDDYYNITYKHNIPGDIRVEFDWIPGSDGKIPKVYLGGEHRFTGYTAHLSADNKVSGYITREPISEQRNEEYSSAGNLAEGQIPLRMEAGQRYRFRCERQGNYVRMYINGFELFNVFDVDILYGPKYQNFGLEMPGGSEVHRVDNVVVSNRPLAQKVSPLTVADTYFRLGDYERAYAYYETLTNAYPGTDVRAQSLYRMGRCYLRRQKYAAAENLFRQFLEEFPEHQLSNYVYYELGRSLVLQRNLTEAKVWFGKIPTDAHENIRQQALISILAYYTEPYNDIGRWNPLTLREPEKIFDEQFDVVAYLKKIEGDWSYWSDRLDISLYQSHAVWMSIPYMYVRMGEFDHVIDRYGGTHFHYAVTDAVRLLGDRLRICEIYPDKKDLERGALLDLGKFDEYLEKFGDKKEYRLHYLWRTGEYDEWEREQGELSHRNQAKLLIARRQYQKILDEYDDLDYDVLLAYRGLGQYEKITHDKFEVWERDVLLCRVLAGEEEEILKKSHPTKPEHIQATSSLMLKALQAGNLELAEKYSHSMENRPLDYWRTYIEAVSIDRFILPLFTRYLIDGDREKFFRQVEAVLAYRVNDRVQYMQFMTNCLLQDEPELPYLYMRGSHDELLKGIRQDVLGNRRQAVEYYKSCLDIQSPHYSDVKHRWAAWRLKVLSE